MTGAVQDASQLQEDASWQLAVQKGRQSQGLELVSRPRARSVLHCHGVVAVRRGPVTGAVHAGRKPAARGRKLAVGSAEGQTQSQGLELVSRQFRKQRLAVWAAGRGPDPSLTATVF